MATGSLSPAPKCFCGKPRQTLSKVGDNRTFFKTCTRHYYGDYLINEREKKELADKIKASS